MTPDIFFTASNRPHFYLELRITDQYQSVRV